MKVHGDVFCGDLVSTTYFNLFAVVFIESCLLLTVFNHLSPLVVHFMSSCSCHGIEGEKSTNRRR